VLDDAPYDEADRHRACVTTPTYLSLRNHFPQPPAAPSSASHLPPA